MVRFLILRLAVLFIVLFAFLGALTGCSSSTETTNFPTPADITVTPASSISIDIGAIQTFTASAHDASNPPRVLVVPIAFQSSNTAVVTIASNGLACAGTWDSLTSPQICTPGSAGVAQITAISQGVTSPPTIVYVHQHVDNVTLEPITQPAPSCVSKGNTLDYQGRAFSHGTDITTSVGLFTWQTLNGLVATVSNSDVSLPQNQAVVTAGTPGTTQIFATVAGVNSVPMQFLTCPVESISLELKNSGSTSFTVTQGTTEEIIPTVVDSMGVTITSVPLTVCSSRPTAAIVGSTNCATNDTDLLSVTTPAAGGASITASCTPPVCNIGLDPSKGPVATGAIYPTSAISAVVTPTSGSTPTGTVYVSSTACPITPTCSATGFVPITFSTYTVGLPVGLPANPNSMLFGPQGTNFFLGTDLGLQGTRGLTKVDVSGTTPTVSVFGNNTGKVLAISPTGAKVILSDTVQTPNQVFIFDTSINSSVSFQIDGATAAAFSPDGLKAFIIAGTKLYVYSLVSALQTLDLGFTGNSVAFLSEGAFAYIAGPSTVAVRRTCDNAPAGADVTTTGTPTLIESLPDGSQMVALNPPNIDLIAVDTGAGPTGCTPTVGNTVISFNLGQGSFTAKQMFLSPDGSKAYIIAPGLPSVPVFNISNKLSTSIPLAGNVTVLAGALTGDGRLLFVTTSDGSVHALDTLTSSDVQQITFPPTSFLCVGSDGTPLSCPPDLIVVKP